MGDPRHDQQAAADVLGMVWREAAGYLAALDSQPVCDPFAASAVHDLDGALPDEGEGARRAVARLLAAAMAAATRSSGPRFYHFVVGGATPAAMAGDWITALLDQNAAGRVSSRFAIALEKITLRWLLDLFQLPADWGGVLVASAMHANLTGLGCATHWWGEQHGVDAAEEGLAGLPPMPVLASGYLHATTRKALQMLGHGRARPRICAQDEAGRLDIGKLERSLAELDQPAVIIATAGEVNTGDFDPVDAMADLATEHGAWLHVDAAFGLYAALSPRSARLVRGVDRADSVGADGHKWLNVPYDSGFAFVRDPSRLARAFGMPSAPYLSDLDEADESLVCWGPESSRRARSLPIWATLAAYGRDGYRALVERHLDLAQHLARRVDEAPDLERLAEVTLCVVCFRFHPSGFAEAELNRINARLGEALLADGRFMAGTTQHERRVALRPALVNWRTGTAEIDLFVDVVREIGAGLLR